MKGIISAFLVTLTLVSALIVAVGIQPVKTMPSTIIVPDDYPTIQQAIGAASSGDTVYVRAGTYNENITLSFDSSPYPLLLLGEDKSNTIVNGSIRLMQYEGEPEGSAIRELQIMGKVSSSRVLNCSISDTVVHSGVWIDGSQRMKVANSLISGGITVTSSETHYWMSATIDITNNTLSGVGVSIGSWVDGITVSANRIFNAAVGIDASSSYAFGLSFTGNNFSNCGKGIGIDWGDYPGVDVVISENSFVNNTFGVFLESQLYQLGNAEIFHNDFMNSPVLTEGINSTSVVWDDGYPSGGNYWSDYNGTDLDGDGIGDTPYIIDDDNQDNYPLMGPYVPFENQTIYIRSDGSIDPPTAPISSVDNVTYILTDNIFSDTDGIVIEKNSSTILDGNGYTIQGSGGGNGISTPFPNEYSFGDVTVKNFIIRDFSQGINIRNQNEASHEIIYRNNITSDLFFSDCGRVDIIGNNMTSGLSFGFCGHVDIVENNLIGSISTSSNVDSGTYLNVSQNSIDGGVQYYGSMHGGVFSLTGNNITGGISSGGDETWGTISGNNIMGGIYFGGEGGLCFALGNNITGGIKFGGYPSCGGTISGNNVKGGIQVISPGRALEISKNYITTNYSGTGIYVSWPFSTVNIFENDIYENDLGISMGDFYPQFPSAAVCHNNFINNTRHVGDATDSYVAYDNGFEGNYWDNYTGIDANHDGIGDTPHVIDSNNTDNYPLMLPYKGHDIAVRDVDVGKTIVAKGTVQKVDVEVANIGSFPQTFSLTVYVNGTETQTLAVTLAAEEVTTVRIYWGTSTMLCGNCSISAYALPVVGETEVANNNLTCGWVLLTLPGDVDGDHDVDIFDFVKMAGVYGVSQSDPRYNANYDIDSNGAIDIFDIVMAAGNYGESW